MEIICLNTGDCRCQNGCYSHIRGSTFLNCSVLIISYAIFTLSCLLIKFVRPFLVHFSFIFSVALLLVLQYLLHKYGVFNHPMVISLHSMAHIDGD